MVVGLSNGIAYTVAIKIGSILVENLLVSALILRLQPGEQSGTDIKTDPSKIFQPGIWSVALLEDALVPVIVRRGSRFTRDNAS